MNEVPAIESVGMKRRRTRSAVLTGITCVCFVWTLDLWARSQTTVDQCVFPLVGCLRVEIASGNGRLLFAAGRIGRGEAVPTLFASESWWQEPIPGGFLNRARILRYHKLESGRFGFCCEWAGGNLVVALPYWALLSVFGLATLVIGRRWWLRRTGSGW